MGYVNSLEGIFCFFCWKKLVFDPIKTMEFPPLTWSYRCFFYFFRPGGEKNLGDLQAIRHCQNPTPHGRTWLKVQRWCPCSLKSMHKRPVDVQDRSFELLGVLVVLQIWSCLGGPGISMLFKGLKGKKTFLLLIFFGEGSCGLIKSSCALILPCFSTFFQAEASL